MYAFADTHSVQEYEVVTPRSKSSRNIYRTLTDTIPQIHSMHLMERVCSSRQVSGSL